MTKVLQVNNITYNYPETKFSLQNINFAITNPGHYALIGLSGSGKSTLLKCIAGLKKLDEGKIIFENREVKGPNEQLIPGNSKIAYLAQDFSLDTYHTVKENIRLKIMHLHDRERDKKLKELLAVTGLSTYENQQPNKLSGGQKQKLAFARALAPEPELLLLDEAFNQLDTENRNRLSSYLKEEMKKRKMSTIWVSHEPTEIFRWADKVLVLHKGKLLRKVTPETLYKYPKTMYEAALLGDFIDIGIGKNKIYLRPENIAFSSVKTQQQITVKETFFNKGTYQSIILWNGKEIAVPSSVDIKPGVHFIKITPYACKTD